MSIQLKNFQNQFDLPLTEIVGRKLYITDFGKEIAEASESIINEVNKINYKSIAYKGQLAGKIKISVVSTGKYVMPYFLSGFLKLHQEVEIKMDVTNKSKVIESLVNNEVDFALVSILPEKLLIESLDLLQNKLYLVGQHPVYDSGNNIDNLLKETPLIIREQGSGTRQVMESFIQNHQITVYKKMELTTNEAVKQAIMAGLGCSIMPLIGIRNEIENQQLKIISVKHLPIKTTWRLIWLKKKKHNLASLTFIEFLKNQKTNIVNEQFSWYEQY